MAMRRRTFLAFAAALPVLGYSRPARAAVLYKSPDCGCCHEHAAYLRQHGYQVKETATPELDEHRHVVRGWARDSRRQRELVAPAHSIGADRAVFEVAWFCPWCTRNQLRVFSVDALQYRDIPLQAAPAR